MSKEERQHLRRMAALQSQISAVEIFASLFWSYRALEPEIRKHTDTLLANLQDDDITEDEASLTLHTLMEALFGDDISNSGPAAQLRGEKP